MVTKKDGKTEGKSASEIVTNNEKLLEMYRQNAKMGAENLGGASPLLKVHTLGRSSANQLADGTEPKDGAFFYKPTQEQFESIDAHILTISRGFRADGFQGKKDVFNQIMAGFIIDKDRMKPFVMYLTGSKLAPMWEFGKAAGKFTRATPFPIPMFALRVKLTTEKVSTKYGNSWIIKFEIQKNEDGSPVIVTDEKVFEYLKTSVNAVKDTIESIIEARSTEEALDEKEDFPDREDHEIEQPKEVEPKVLEVEPKKELMTENVDVDQIPF